MPINLQLENEVFELFDKLAAFVGDHALLFSVGVIMLTLVGGAWLLVVLRNNHAARPSNTETSLTVGYGVVLGNPSPANEPPPPFPTLKPENCDELRD